MDKILHDPKDPKLWELWYIPYYGSCRILSINRSSQSRSFVGLDPWGLDPGAWKKPKLSKSEVNLKKVEKIHEKSKPVCEQSNR